MLLRHLVLRINSSFYNILQCMTNLTASEQWNEEKIPCFVLCTVKHFPKNSDKLDRGISFEINTFLTKSLPVYGIFVPFMYIWSCTHNMVWGGDMIALVVVHGMTIHVGGGVTG